MFIEAGGHARSIDILPILGATLPMDGVNVTSCECADESDMAALKAVVASCGSAAKLNHRLSGILRLFIVMEEVSMRSATHRVHAIKTEQSEGAEVSRSRRLSGTILLTEELGHLARQFERTKPSCWWCVAGCLLVEVATPEITRSFLLRA